MDINLRSRSGSYQTGQHAPANKVHLTPTEDVQNEALIRIWELHILMEGGGYCELGASV